MSGANISNSHFCKGVECYLKGDYSRANIELALALDEAVNKKDKESEKYAREMLHTSECSTFLDRAKERFVERDYIQCAFNLKMLKIFITNEEKRKKIENKINEIIEIYFDRLIDGFIEGDIKEEILLQNLKLASACTSNEETKKYMKAFSEELKEADKNEENNCPEIPQLVLEENEETKKYMKAFSEEPKEADKNEENNCPEIPQLVLEEKTDENREEVVNYPKIPQLALEETLKQSCPVFP